MFVCDHVCMRRRELLVGVGVSSTVSLTGCLGGGNNDQASSSEDNNKDGGSKDSDGNSNNEDSDEMETEEQELFDSVEVEGRELVVSLVSDRAEEAQTVRVEFPNDEEDQNIEGISTARIDLVEYGLKLPGDWIIQATDSSGSVIEETTYTAEVELEVSQVGTLAELGVRSDSAGDEHNLIQITVENTSNMPIATGGELTDFNTSYDYSYSQTTDRFTERAGFDEEFVAPGQNINLWFRIVRQTEVEQVINNTYEASGLIRFEPRVELTVPLKVNFEGPIVNDGSPEDTYADNTTASLR